jgi:hypothetical protein
VAIEFSRCRLLINQQELEEATPFQVIDLLDVLSLLFVLSER